MGSGIVKQLKLLTPQMLVYRVIRAMQLREHKGKDLTLGLGTKLNGSKIGNRVYINSDNVFLHSSIGDNSYINDHSDIRFATIGKFCSIGPHVKIGLGGHPLHFVSSHPAFYANNKVFMTFADRMYYQEFKEVIIGNDVWIGEGAVIPGGVTIGDGAAIGARAVVTKDVEPYSFVAGVPARFVKYRFDEEIRKKLLQIKWWDKDISWLARHFKSFHNPAEFVKMCEEDIEVLAQQ